MCNLYKKRRINYFKAIPKIFRDPEQLIVVSGLNNIRLLSDNKCL